MSTDTMSTFFALLSLACWGGTLVTLGVVIAVRRNPDSALANLRDGIADSALWLAWVVAAVTTAGSLYYSQVAHFIPCELCWFQRICMYPLAAILLVAALSRDTRIWRYVLPQITAGTLVAIYHTQLQIHPEQHSFCELTNPCTITYVWKFGFVSLPFMALAAFTFIGTMVLLSRTTSSAPVVHDPTDEPTSSPVGASAP